MNPIRSAVLALALSAAGASSGCKSAPSPVAYARPFPPGARQADTLNIQVFRRETKVELTNTTATPFANFTLWLNRRFARPVASFGVGQTLIIPLAEFRDEYSAPFRGGGFWASEDPEKLVQAQIEAAGADGAPTIRGLIVVGRE